MSEDPGGEAALRKSVPEVERSAGSSQPRAAHAVEALAAVVETVGVGRRSLAGRLIRLAAIWFIFLLILVGLGLTAYFHHAALSRFQVNIGQMSENLYADAEIGEDGALEVPPFFDTRTRRVRSGLYWQISQVGANDGLSDAAISRSLWNDRLSVPPQAMAGMKAMSTQMDSVGLPYFFDGTGPNGEPLRVAGIYSLLEGEPYVFLAAEDRTAMNADVRTFAILTATALLLMAGGSLLAIFLQVRIGLRPLFELTDEIARVRQGSQSRVTGQYPSEITPVAGQINALLDHAQDIVERQRTHVGNLAHALKTPLSVLLTSAGDVAGELPEMVRRQVAQMKGHVDHHLRRARAAARSSAMGERTEIEPVIDELAVMLEQVFRDKGVVIDWRVEEGLSFRGEKQDFQEIAGNLMENACLWCRRKVRILTEFDVAGQILVLNVEDDGPGLEEARYGDVLKRGARLDESVPGSGLGLSIVDELVRAYGGELGFSRAQAGGLRVSVRLPAHLEG